MYYHSNLFKRRRLWLLFFVLGLTLIGGSVSLLQKQAIFTINMESRPLTVGIKAPIETLHPALIEKQGEKLISRAIYEGLVCYDEEHKHIQPLLASSWKFSDGGKTLELKLRKDVRFHNGKKMTAADVKVSWQRNLAATKEWSNISLFMPIAGAKEQVQGARKEISGIEVLNDRTLRIRFAKPHAAYLYILTHPMFAVMDEAEENELGAGTGPYCLKEKQADTMVLVPWEQYYRGKPKLSAIQVKSYSDEDQALKDFKNGRLDYLDDVPQQEIRNLTKDKEMKKLLLRQPALENYWLGFNMNREPFANNYLLRRALNYAIDRDAIIKKVFGGGYRPALGVVPDGMPTYQRKIYGYRYDLEKARQLMAEAGYSNGEGLPPLTLKVNRDEGHEEVGREIANQLALVGVKVEIDTADWDYYKTQMHRLDMSFFRLGWKADYPDADNFLYSLFHSSGVGLSNFVAYRNPQVDKVLDHSRRQYKNGEERIKQLKRAEEIIIDDAPCLFLFQKEAAKLVSQDVQGLLLNGMEEFDWFKIYLSKPKSPAPPPDPKEMSHR